MDKLIKDCEKKHSNVTEQAIKTIAGTIDAKDLETRCHSNRVAEICVEIGRIMDLPKNSIEDLYATGLLHDIGKIGVHDDILKKPGKLSEEEFEKIKKHPVIGADVLKKLTVVDDVATGAMYHHERFDGKGYPNGLKGDEIPLFGRIICVVDAFDAMVSDRPYRKGLNIEFVREELIKCSGSQFDPEVVNAMLKYIDLNWNDEK